MLTQEPKKGRHNLINLPSCNPISFEDIINNYEIHFREQQAERMLLLSRLRATGEILKQENFNLHAQPLPAYNICRYSTLTKRDIEIERNRQLSLQQQAMVTNCMLLSASSNLQPYYSY